MPTLLTFPGQGAQRPGMLHMLPEHRAISRTLAEASDVLGANVLRHDDAGHLASTVSVQLCLLVAGVASARALIEGLRGRLSGYLVPRLVREIAGSHSKTPL